MDEGQGDLGPGGGGRGGRTPGGDGRGAGQQEGRGAGRRVLVIEDDAHIKDLLTDVLTGDGFAVTGADSVLGALASPCAPRAPAPSCSTWACPTAPGLPAHRPQGRPRRRPASR